MTKSSQAGFIKYILIIIILVVILAILNVDLAAWLDWHTWPDRLMSWWQWLHPHLTQIIDWIDVQIRQPVADWWQNFRSSTEDIET